MPETYRKSDEFGPPGAPVRLYVRTADPDPLDLNADLAVTGLRNFRIRKRKAPGSSRIATLCESGWPASTNFNAACVIRVVIYTAATQYIERFPGMSLREVGETLPQTEMS